MGARIDKYDGKVGGFRAVVASDLADADVGVPIGVGLNSSGQIVKGAGQTGVIGVLIDEGLMTGGVRKGTKAGESLDVMQLGDIVDLTGLTAGTLYYAASNGVISTTNTGKLIGFTAEASRMVVRVGIA